MDDTQADVLTGHFVVALRAPNIEARCAPLPPLPPPPLPLSLSLSVTVFLSLSPSKRDLYTPFFSLLLKMILLSHLYSLSQQ